MTCNVTMLSQVSEKIEQIVSFQRSAHSLFARSEFAEKAKHG